MNRHFTIIFILACSKIFGQTIALQFDRQSIAYLGIDNPITILAENTNCNNLIIIPRIGLITRDSLNLCKYNYKSKKIGSDIIRISKLDNNGDTVLLEERQIGVHRLPLVGELGYSHNGGQIDQKILLQFPKKFSVCALNTGLDLHIPIDSFIVIITKKCKVTFRKEYSVKDDLSELLKEFALLEKYDNVIFCDMRYRLNEMTHSDDYMQLFIK